VGLTVLTLYFPEATPKVLHYTELPEKRKERKSEAGRKRKREKGEERAPGIQ